MGRILGRALPKISFLAVTRNTTQPKQKSAALVVELVECIENSNQSIFSCVLL